MGDGLLVTGQQPLRDRIHICDLVLFAREPFYVLQSIKERHRDDFCFSALFSSQNQRLSIPSDCSQLRLHMPGKMLQIAVRSIFVRPSAPFSHNHFVSPFCLSVEIVEGTMAVVLVTTAGRNQSAVSGKQ